MHRPSYAWVLFGLAALSLAACGGGGAGSSAGTLPPAIGQPSIRVPMSTLTPASTLTAPAYASAVLAAGPIAYYQLGDSGATAYDSSGNNLNGNVGSSVTELATGLLSGGDSAMRFPGTRSASGVVSVPANSKFVVGSKLTMELLLRFTATPATYSVPLSYGSDSSYAPYDLYFKNGRIVAQFNLSSGVLTVMSSSALQPNVTYYVAATYNGSTASLYVNGAAVASKNKSGTLTGYSNHYGLSIGDDAGYSDPGFAGTVDDVAIYAMALSATTIQSHYAAATTATAASSPTPAAAPTPTAAPVASTSSTNVATYDGCPVFTAGDWYNAPVTSASVDPNSAAYINGNYSAGNTGGAETYFPSYEYVNVAGSATQLLTVQQQVSYHTFSAPYPWAPTFKIEGAGDHHSIVIDPTPHNGFPACHLYEAYSTTYSATTNTLSAFSGFNWDLTKPWVSPAKDQPSAMASGLSLFAGAIKWEDIQTGAINHALNIALPAGTACYLCFVQPASDAEGYAFKGSSSYEIPYGAHLRLKASFDVSHFSAQGQAVLKALQTYGAFVADTGSAMELWNLTPLDGNNTHYDAAGINAALGALRITDFDVLTLPPIQHF
ncbi:LamG domain-containing protein [bacterium]|nr:MAG: LamG domain-containing protein [bacterium]